MPCYNPFVPNAYGKAAYTVYARKRRLEETKAYEGKLSGNCLAESLHSSGMDASGAPSPTEGPVALNLSAEELHKLRVRKSAAMGVKSAVDLEREILEVEHKKVKLEGSDVKSRIGSLLGKMRQQKSEKETTKLHEATAPLTFKASPLAAGGFMMEKADKVSTRSVKGKPSSALLIVDQTLSVPTSLLDEKSTAEMQERFFAPTLEAYRTECGQSGVVRSAKCVVIRGVHMDEARVRFFIRFDTVADAFKASDGLIKNHSQETRVHFYPTAEFDAGNFEKDFEQ